MKEDEKKFFITCYEYRKKGICIRDIVNVLNQFIHYKRCWYLLSKWADLGFYDYGVALDLGWFDDDEMPDRYKELIKDLI